MLSFPKHNNLRPLVAFILVIATITLTSSFIWSIWATRNGWSVGIELFPIATATVLVSVSR